MKESLIDNKKAESCGTSKVNNEKRRDRSHSPIYRKECKVNQVEEKREWSPPDSYDIGSTVDTPLAASTKHIFEVNKGKCIFQRTFPLSSWKAKDKKRYCDYHESTGHNTHECKQL